MEITPNIFLRTHSGITIELACDKLFINDKIVGGFAKEDNGYWTFQRNEYETITPDGWNIITRILNNLNDMLTPPKPPKPPNFEKGCPPNILLDEFLNLKTNLKLMAEDFEALKNKADPVNNPAHYTAGKIQAIDFIEDQKMNFHLGVALQYIIRAGKKNPEKTVEDLQKAIWYINRFIDFYASENKTDDK